jgi:hypothetical protein
MGFEHRQCPAARGIKVRQIDELRWKRCDGLRPHLNVRLRGRPSRTLDRIRAPPPTIV